MKRGELWTLAGGPGYAGKPRPVLIVQDDTYGETVSITICPITTEGMGTAVLRQALKASPDNGLHKPSRVMIEKITTVPRGRLGKRIGALSVDDLARVDRALLVFLGLAG
jgi:mRNA interferase MazF